MILEYHYRLAPLCEGDTATSQPAPMCWAKSHLGTCTEGTVSSMIGALVPSFNLIPEIKHQVLLVLIARAVVLSTVRQDSCVYLTGDTQFFKDLRI